MTDLVVGKVEQLTQIRTLERRSMWAEHTVEHLRGVVAKLRRDNSQLRKDLAAALDKLRETKRNDSPHVSGPPLATGQGKGKA